MAYLRYIPIFIVLILMSTQPLWAHKVTTESTELFYPFSSPNVTALADGFSIPYTSNWDSNLSYNHATAKVILYVDENFKNFGSPSYFTTPFNCTLTFAAVCYRDDNSTFNVSGSLTVRYDPRKGQFHTDKAVYQFEDAYRVDLTVNSVTPGSLPDSIVRLKVEIEREWYHNFNKYLSIDTAQTSYSQSNGMITFNWTAVEEAEAYDLEWTHISDLSVDSDGNITYIPKTSLVYTFIRNASRVTISDNSFSIPEVYESGYLVFRIRPVGIDSIYHTQRIEGKWTFSSSTALVIVFPYRNTVYTGGHEDSLNWQYTINFSEEGKQKLGISYFDGSLRSRQQLTRLMGDDYTVVKETIYDRAGRPAIEVLPAPTGNSRVKYYDLFNRNTSGNAYSWVDFDSFTCTITANPMDTSSGASRYYSSANPDTVSYQKLVPDAMNYPFVHTQFTPDNTGRISRQSGAGYYHRLGSGHESRYYYHTPAQQELDRLFGVEVGYAEHYKKNYVIDANGQVSISYVNMKGQTIATALSGESPSGLDSLSSALPAERMEEDLTEKSYISLDGKSISVTKDIVVDMDGSVYYFDYQFIGAAFKELACQDSSFCYDCVYDLSISLKDECNNELNPFTQDTAYTLTIGSINPDSCDAVFASLDLSQDSFYVVLDIGAYTLTKTLSINEKALNTYTNDYFNRNTCLMSEQDFIDEEIARIDSTECLIGLDTIDSKCYIYKKTMMIDMSPGGQYANFSISSGGSYSATEELSILNTGSTYFAANHFQNICYKDENGDSIYVYNANNSWVSPDELDLEDFVNLFDPEWAVSMFQFHPEYGVYEQCTYNEASDLYDRNLFLTDSFSHACDSGFFYPVQHSFTNAIMPAGFLTGCNSSTNYDPYFSSNATRKDTVIDRMENTYGRTDTTLYDLAWEIMKYRTDSLAALACNSYYNMLDTEDSLQAFWESFRGLYYAEKQKLQERYLLDSLDDYPNYLPDCVFEGNCTDEWADKEVRFPTFYDLYNYDTNNQRSNYQNVYDEALAEANSQAGSFCDTHCLAMSAMWMMAFEDCFEFADVETGTQDSILNCLVAICSKGCGTSAPYGSISLPSSDPSVIYGQSFTSFDEVLIYFLGDQYADSLCSPYLIDFPMEIYHHYFGTDCNDIDSCVREMFILACEKYSCETYYDYSCTDTVSSKANAFVDLLNYLENQDSLYIYDIDLFDEHLQQIFPVDDIGYNDRVEYLFNMDTLGSKNKIWIKFNIDEMPWCYVELELQDTTSIDFFRIDSFAGIRPDTGKPSDFYIDAYYANGWKYTFKGFGPCLGTNTCAAYYTEICTHNLSTFDSFFNYLFDAGLSIEEMDTLMCRLARGDSYTEYAEALRDSGKIKCDDCAYCADFMAAYDDFLDEFSWFSASDEPDTITNYYKFFTNYMNNELDKNLTYLDYMDFFDLCDSIGDSNQYRYTICNEEIFKSETWESPCLTVKTSIAGQIGKAKYRTYKDSVTKAFQEAYIDHCAAAFNKEQFDMDYPFREYHYTLYYYDQAGNLVKTVPPAGVSIITHADSLSGIRAYRDSVTYNGSLPGKVYTHHSLASQYSFNSYNQPVTQSTPDAGSSDFWYDRFGRLRASRNAKQACYAPDRYSYTSYDDLGRIIEVGECSATADPDLGDMDSTDFPLSWGAAFSEITHTFYDTAAFIISGFSQENLRNRVSTTAYYDVGRDYYDHATHYTYDIHGNVNSLIQENRNLLEFNEHIKRIDYEYDLINGNVNAVYYQNDSSDQFIHRYEYDEDNRLKYVITSRDSSIWNQEAKYDYYKHGPLARTEIGDNGTQGLDYAYTIQGWLKGLNSATLQYNRDMGFDGFGYSGNSNINFARDAIGFTLGYFDNDYSAIGPQVNFEASISGSNLQSARKQLYNGNINHMVTAIREFIDRSEKIQGTVYTYDQLNRIKAMDVYRDIDTAGNAWGSGSTTYLGLNTSYSYDANGNLNTLDRYANANGGVSYMDLLSYHYYDNSNKLEYVTDNVSTTKHNIDIDNQQSGNYEYDSIGNLVTDASEGLSINWNVAGKIKRIEQYGHDHLLFRYDALGNRVEKAHIDTNSNWYVRDASGNIMAIYNLLQGSHSRPSLMDTADFLELLYKSIDTTVFYQEILEPVLTDPSVLNSIRQELLAGDYSDAKSLIENNVYSTEDFGRLINIVLREKSLTLDTNGDTMTRTSITANYFVDEYPLYGSSRLGIYKADSVLKTYDYSVLLNPYNAEYFNPLISNISYPSGGESAYKLRKRGKRLYELTNHLGNVLSTVSDRKRPVDQNSNDTADYFEPDIITACDYYPFGMQMPGRNYGVHDTIVDSVFHFTYNIDDWNGSHTLSHTADGRLKSESTTQWTNTYRTFDLEIGKRYRVSFDLDLGNSTVLAYLMCNHWWWGDRSYVNIVYSSGHYEFEFTATVGHNDLIFERQLSSGSTYYFYIDNVKVEEVHSYYTFGFQGQEKDDEIKGAGNSINYKFRMYDPRLGRFFAVDPLAKKYPFYSSYAFSGNRVIDMVELEGLEPAWKGTEGVTHTMDDGSTYEMRGGDWAKVGRTIPEVTVRGYTNEYLEKLNILKVDDYKSYEDHIVKGGYPLMKALLTRKSDLFATVIANREAKGDYSRFMFNSENNIRSSPEFYGNDGKIHSFGVSFKLCLGIGGEFEAFSAHKYDKYGNFHSKNYTSGGLLFGFDYGADVYKGTFTPIDQNYHLEFENIYGLEFEKSFSLWNFSYTTSVDVQSNGNIVNSWLKAQNTSFSNLNDPKIYQYDEFGLGVGSSFGYTISVPFTLKPKTE